MSKVITRSAKTGIEDYKRALESKSAEVRRSMSAQKAAQVVSRRDCVGDEGDMSQQSHEEWIFLNRNTLDVKLLREVESALHRIETGAYGTCQDCEEPINPKRLAAVPWARFCVACQERISALTEEEYQAYLEERRS